MRLAAILTVLSLPAVLAQSGEFKTAGQVLDRYKQALGGEQAIRAVHSETRHGEATAPGSKSNITFISYAKPFRTLSKVKLPGGQEVTSGFNGEVSWSIGPQGTKIDTDVPLESVRRDADLQYALHQPDYFTKFELAGITDFEGHRCYWLHGTTHWGKDNNQFYDVETGLLRGYRFQSDSSQSAVVTTTVFEDYKNFGGPLVATRITARTGDRVQIVTFTSVSYAPLDDSVFQLPSAVKALLKAPK